MTTVASEKRLGQLVEAFTELGPAWVRWVNACLPTDAVSYARMRVLYALHAHGQLSMSHLATALGVSPRRVTVLVEALEEDGLVRRQPHPTDGRSTLVAITEDGERYQRESWEQHQSEVAVAFGDLPVKQQEQLLIACRNLTIAFRTRLAERAQTPAGDCQPFSS